jgi:hypothetical protein
MVKNTTSREDKVLKQLKKAFPTYSFGNYLDMGRLIQPQSFDYKNRSRLEKEFTEKIIQQIADITLLIRYLNAKHKAEILTSGEFNEFMKGIMDLSRFGKIDKDYLASFYPNMVKHGIKGITNNLPQEFAPLIEEHLKPLLLLLSSITNYSKQVGKSGTSAYGKGKFELWDGTL